MSQWLSLVLAVEGSSLACGVVPADPVFVSWTLHALDKARQLGFARSDVEVAVLGGHRERRLNAGKAGWLIVGKRIVMAYEHPDGDDPLTARGHGMAALAYGYAD